MIALGNHRWPEVGRAVLAVPLGATEQHGPHLPLDTDTSIADELCRRLSVREADVLTAPALPYGSSGEHADFPGTLSIGRAALEQVLVELVRSADHFAGVVLVNGHGGNAAALRGAVRILRADGRNVLAWSPSGSPDDTHAGCAETSVMLQLRAGDVLLEAAEAGNTTPLPRLLDRLVGEGVRSVSANGVLGDPSGASAAKGKALLTAWTDELVGAVRRWREA